MLANVACMIPETARRFEEVVVDMMVAARHEIRCLQRRSWSMRWKSIAHEFQLAKQRRISADVSLDD